MRWEDELALAKKQARVVKMMLPMEVTVDLWLSCYRQLFPDDRIEKTAKHDAQMLRPFRRVHGHLKMWDYPTAEPGTTVTPLIAQGWALNHPGHVRWLEHAWKKAVLMGIAPLNYWKMVELPKRTKAVVRPPSAVELEGILAVCRGHEKPWMVQLANMVEVAAYTGARVGGLCRLKLDDVDLAARRMVVTEKGEKTRTVALVAPAAAAMGRALEHRTWFCDCRLRDIQADGECACGRPYDKLWPSRRGRQPMELFGRRRDPLKFVFRAEAGTPLTPSLVATEWGKVRGTFPHGFHSLKHFAATWLAEQGADQLDIAIQLGHTDSEGRPYRRLLERVYDHPDPEKALARLERAVG